MIRPQLVAHISNLQTTADLKLGFRSYVEGKFLIALVLILGVFRGTTLLYGQENTWISLGPRPGTVVSIVEYGSSMNDVFAAMYNGGVFVNRFDTSSWSPQNYGLPHLRVRAMAGSAAGDSLYVGIEDGGVFKNTNLRMEWVPHSTGLGNLTVLSLAVDPQKPTIVYAGTQSHGVFRSTDAALHWNAVATGMPSGVVVNALVIDPAAPQTILAATKEQGVFKTTNSGLNWVASNTGLMASNGTAVAEVLTLANDSSHSKVVYAGTGRFGVFKSLDQGSTWSSVSWTDGEVGIESLRTDPLNGDIVYAGSRGAGVFRSVDGGKQWTAFNQGMLPTATVSALSIPVAPPERIYAGSVQGIYRAARDADRWTHHSDGPSRPLSVNGVVADPVDPNVLYLGAERGVYKSTDAGGSWTATSSGIDWWTFSDVFAVAVDPVDNQVLYAATNAGLYKSTNGGETWRLPATFSPSTNVLTVVVDSKNTNRVYAGTSHQGLLKSVDGGLTWRQLNPSYRVDAIVIDPTNSDVLYVATTLGVFKTLDAGEHWVAINEGVSYAGMLDQSVSALAIDRTDPRVIYSGLTRYGIRKTSDGGATWTILERGFHVRSLAIDPTDSRTVFAGTGTLVDGVLSGALYKSVDGGQTWSLLIEGMGSAWVSGLAFAPSDHNRLYAATLGKGGYVMPRVLPVPGITILSPNGKEHWTIGSVREIRWTTTGNVDNVRIEYSIDGGASFVSLANSVPNSGRYRWVVPDSPSSQARVRITEASGSLADVSNGEFIISSCTYATSPSSRFYEAGETFDQFNVETQEGCPWTAASQLDWIAVVAGDAGAGSGVVRFKIAANPGSIPRSGSLAIADRQFLITQSGVSQANDINLFVPVVLSSAGANNSFFTSELILANKGNSDGRVQFTYRSSEDLGGGSGTASISLPARRQLIIQDAISYLRLQGIPIPESGNHVGTLSLRFSGLTSPTSAVASARTTTVVPQGRAGLAYPAVRVDSSTLSSDGQIFGLRQTLQDRSNLALQNAGSQNDGSVTLKVGVSSDCLLSDSGENVTLLPGGFYQLSGVLSRIGAENGCASVTRVDGTAPFFVYGVVNDQATSDGCFIPPVSRNTLFQTSQFIIPVIVEGNSFSSELIVANSLASERRLLFEFVSDSLNSSDKTARFSLALMPGEQRIIPNLIQYLREEQTGVGPVGSTYAGVLFVKSQDGYGFFHVGSRASVPGGGGQFGLYFNGVPLQEASKDQAWLFGLRQDKETRSNLALVNIGAVNNDESRFSIDLYNGDTGELVQSVEGVTVPARRWLQIGQILAVHAPGVSQGYARIRRVEGSNPFVAYAVVNDGGEPGERTGDGAFVLSVP